MDHNNIPDIRLSIFEKSSTKIKYLYDSFNSQGNAFLIGQKHNLDQEAWIKFLLTVGDIILGFYKIEDTIQLLQQELGIDAATAEALGVEVLEFLAPLSDPNWQPPVELDETPEDTFEGSDGEQFAIPVKSPALFTTPTPVHTLASDMDTVRSEGAAASPVVGVAPSEPIAYRSTQSSRLPLEDIPTYTPTLTLVEPEVPAAPDRPRWSSDL
jgi:hypothetical protein